MIACRISSPSPARLRARGMHITIETAGTVFAPWPAHLDEHQPEAGQLDAFPDPR